MDWRKKIKEELSKDPVKEIHEDRNIGGSGNGFTLKFDLKVVTFSGMVFSTSDMCWFDKVKDLPEKERSLMNKAYEAALAALE